MKIKGIIAEDTVNYKKTSMYISFPCCSFKCDRENGCQLCQNSSLVKLPDIDVSATRLVDYFLSQTLSKAIVCCGLEPLDSFPDVLDLLAELRRHTDADFVIYTGYTEEEAADKIEQLRLYPNVIMKFGRFRPNEVSHYDAVLGVDLVSHNQYAKKIS